MSTDLFNQIWISRCFVTIKWSVWTTTLFYRYIHTKFKIPLKSLSPLWKDIFQFKQCIHENNTSYHSIKTYLYNYINSIWIGKRDIFHLLQCILIYFAMHNADSNSWDTTTNMLEQRVIVRKRYSTMLTGMSFPFF